MENNSNNPFSNKHDKDRELALQLIVKQVEKGTGESLSELKEQFTERALFAIALRHTTTTKKAFCTALEIPVESGCRYKRLLEKDGNLVQSAEKVICPLTKHLAHLISTNPKEFERLRKSSADQLNLF